LTPTLITFEYVKLICIFYRDFLEAYERPKGESETGENDDLSQEGERHFWTPSCNTARAKVPCSWMKDVRSRNVSPNRRY
jgi:hypothetical protein